MREASIITLYQCKGDHGDCNNYQGISLLVIVGKPFASVVLNRLQPLAERVYPEAQCRFQAGQSMTQKKSLLFLSLSDPNSLCFVRVGSASLDYFPFD